MFLDKKTPFQFGDPRNGDFIVFDCIDLGMEYSPSLKLNRAESKLFDGEARLNGDEPNKRDNTSIVLSFTLQKGTMYTEAFILSLFSNSPRKLFVYEQIDGGNGFKVLWQYAECVTMPKITGGVNIVSEEYEKYTVTLVLANPEFYEADVSYFVPNQTLYKFTDTPMFQFLNTGAIQWGSYEIDSFPSFSGLSLNEKKAFLKGKTPLSVLDKYFNKESYIITPELTKTISSTPLFTTTEGLDLETSLPTEMYMIEFEPLDQNEYIHILNITTNSDLTIRWLSPVANTNNLLFTSVDNLLFDTSTHKQINPEYYEIDMPTTTPLYFNKYLQWYNNQNLLVQRNTDNLMLQSSSSNTIKIETLKAFI